jgi:hypothetical protein
MKGGTGGGGGCGCGVVLLLLLLLLLLRLLLSFSTGGTHAGGRLWPYPSSVSAHWQLLHCTTHAQTGRRHCAAAVRGPCGQFDTSTGSHQTAGVCAAGEGWLTRREERTS